MGIFIGIPALNHAVLKGCYKKLGNPVFDAEGVNIAYTAADDHAAFVIKNGQIISPEFLNVDNPTFGADQSIAYLATIGTLEGNLVSNLSSFVMVNQKKVSPKFKSSVTYRFDKTGKNIYFAGFEQFDKMILIGSFNLGDLK